MDLDIIELGKPYPPLVNSGEGLSARFDETGFSVFITFNFPTKEEVKAFHDKPMEFGIAAVEDVPFFVMHSGLGVNWFDTPIVRIPDTKELNINDGNGYIVKLVLADAVSGTVCAMRAFTLSNEVSKCALKVFGQTIKLDLKDAESQNRITQLQKMYTTDQIVSICEETFKLQPNPTDVEGFN